MWSGDQAPARAGPSAGAWSPDHAPARAAPSAGAWSPDHAATALPLTTHPAPLTTWLLLFLPRLIILISLDDLLHERVPDNVRLGQVHDADALQVTQAVDGIDQTAAHLARQIRLGDIAGHNDLGA